MRARFLVLTMCHCDEPDDCTEHWEVGIPVIWTNQRDRRVSVAADMTGPFRTLEDAALFADAKNKVAGDA